MFEISAVAKRITDRLVFEPTSHCTSTGGCIGSHQVESKIGSGRFSTVWKVKSNTTDHIAVKSYRTGVDNMRYFINEVRILNKIITHSMLTDELPLNIIEYLDTFVHIAYNKALAPKLHPCILFRLAGDSLGELLKMYIKQHQTGIPISMIQKIMYEVFIALAFLHKCDIIHADIKPENILLTTTAAETSIDNLSIRIIDFGSSTTASELFSDSPGTTQYMAPELIIEMPYDHYIDIWSAYSMCFELISGDYLFDVYNECDLYPDIDICAACKGSVSSNSSGSEEGADQQKVNYRHLLLIAKLIGYPPSEFAANARLYYNRQNKLKNHPDLILTSIQELLYANYDLPLDDCRIIEDFLLTGLKYNPAERLSARQVLLHPWLEPDASDL